MERIQDWTGKTIGWREVKPNGDIVIRDFYGTILGRYDRRCDVIRDFYGTILARGDQSGMLVHDVDLDR